MRKQCFTHGIVISLVGIASRGARVSTGRAGRVAAIAGAGVASTVGRRTAGGTEGAGAGAVTGLQEGASLDEGERVAVDDYRLVDLLLELGKDLLERGHVFKLEVARTLQKATGELV
jgi:hypothetical protein